jgi:transcriptional regulator with XRE-family HTH domain
MSPVTRKFEYFLETYRRADGRRWGGQDLHDATGGIVTRSYVTNLRKGRIANPGYEKLAAIAKAMGFPPKLWFEELHDLSEPLLVQGAETNQTLSGRLNYLFEVIKDQRTGKSYSNAQVSRMTLGDLTEEEIESIRTGSDHNPSIIKVIALADAFGVHSSYFLDQSKKPPIINQEALDIFRDQTVSAIARKSLQLPSREKQAILEIIRQLESTRQANHDEGP